MVAISEVWCGAARSLDADRREKVWASLMVLRTIPLDLDITATASEIDAEQRVRGRSMGLAGLTIAGTLSSLESARAPLACPSSARTDASSHVAGLNVRGWR